MIAGLLLVIAGVFHLYPQRNHNVSTNNTAVATSTTAMATSSSAAATTASTTTVATHATAPTPAFAIDPRDSGFLWKLPNPAPTSVIKKNQKEISSLTGELHKGKYSDYDIYLQLGQDYEIVGNGKQAYESYRTASALKPTQGVAMSNIGLLMTKVGALHTAQNAYKQSVLRQPSVSLFWVLYLKFLTRYQPRASETPAMFALARTKTHNNTNVLITEAQWLASVGQTKKAISDWKIIRKSAQSQQQQAIDARIARLQSGI